MQVTAINDELAVGDPPGGSSDIRELVKKRFLSILNLRLPQEDGTFPSREEGIAAAEAGLTHLNFPVGAADLDEFHIEAFRTKLSLLPAPTYVHGGALAVPATLALINHARQQHWDAERTLEFARELDLPCRGDQWQRVLRQQLPPS